jgi:hypothetical protein
MIYNDPEYFWRLYDVCSKGGPFWIIKTNPYEHTCVQEITRSDHTQLTTKMIAWAIKRELAEDMNSMIKGIRALLRAKFPGVTPSYSKVWRGREETIAQIFRSWEGSYGILPRLFSAIQLTNPEMKYIILSEPTNRSEYHYFKCSA